MQGIPYTDGQGRTQVLPLAELHSAGRTHSHVAYALGLDDTMGCPTDRDIQTLLKRFPVKQVAFLLDASLTRVNRINVDTRGYATHWKPWELDAIRKWGAEDVMRLTGRTYEAVMGKRRELGLNPPRLYPLYTADEDLVIKQHGPREAASMLGRSLEGVRKRRNILKRREAP